MTIHIDKQTLDDWYTFLKQVQNGYHMSNWDYMEFTRLNHLVMEASHEIHNDNMMNHFGKDR